MSEIETVRLNANARPVYLALASTTDKKPKKILPPPGREIYNGAFVGDNVSNSSIEAYENKTGGEKLDIVLKFLAFKTGLNFPTDEAEAAARKGGSIFIKFEPWSWQGKDDQSFSPEKIIRGDFDSYLERFAKGCKKFGKPIFLSFGHEMNGDWYPWSEDSELFKKAYIYVHNKLTKMGCNNITWVWNPNIDFGRFNEYFPGDEYVDWVALDGYNTEDYQKGNWRSPDALYGPTLEELRQFNKPIMIGETACDANDLNDENVRKPKFLGDMLDWMVDNGVKAFIYFDQDKSEGGEPKEWAIDRNASIKAMKDAFKKHHEQFKGGINMGMSVETNRPVQQVPNVPKVIAQSDSSPVAETYLSGVLQSAYSFGAFNGGTISDKGKGVYQFKTNKLCNDAGTYFVLDANKIKGKKTMTIEVISLNKSGGGRPAALFIDSSGGDNILYDLTLEQGLKKEIELSDLEGFNKLNIMLATGGDKANCGSIDVKIKVTFK